MSSPNGIVTLGAPNPAVTATPPAERQILGADWLCLKEACEMAVYQPGTSISAVRYWLALADKCEARYLALKEGRVMP